MEEAWSLSIGRPGAPMLPPTPQERQNSSCGKPVSSLSGLGTGQSWQKHNIWYSRIEPSGRPSGGVETVRRVWKEVFEETELQAVEPPFPSPSRYCSEACRRHVE